MRECAAVRAPRRGERTSGTPSGSAKATVRRWRTETDAAVAVRVVDAPPVSVRPVPNRAASLRPAAARSRAYRACATTDETSAALPRDPPGAVVPAASLLATNRAIASAPSSTCVLAVAACLWQFLAQRRYLTKDPVLAEAVIVTDLSNGACYGRRVTMDEITPNRVTGAGFRPRERVLRSLLTLRARGHHAPPPLIDGAPRDQQSRRPHRR